MLEGSGVNWQNRGASFRLESDHLWALAPGKKPFHTLNPAAARLQGGKTMVYGTMGGDGQPQTQAALFTRHAVFGQSLQQAVSGPRWLLGRTWGQNSDTLKIEDRFAPGVIDDLKARGHEIEIYPAFSETMGHAGAILRHPNGCWKARPIRAAMVARSDSENKQPAGKPGGLFCLIASGRRLAAEAFALPGPHPRSVRDSVSSSVTGTPSSS